MKKKSGNSRTTSGRMLGRLVSLAFLVQRGATSRSSRCAFPTRAAVAHLQHSICSTLLETGCVGSVYGYYFLLPLVMTSCVFPCLPHRGYLVMAAKFVCRNFKRRVSRCAGKYRPRNLAGFARLTTELEGYGPNLGCIFFTFKKKICLNDFSALPN